jgi:beta-glucosidase
VIFQRSTVDQLTAPDAFFWASGIEDTFITEPWPKTGRTLDEYELTEHYTRWRQDIDLMAGLGVSAARYGVPWHRINPAKGVWEWKWADGALEHLLSRGVEPIVDLVHYGLPRWIEGSFLHPDFPSYMAEYAARLAERFKGRIRAYTPLNEPRITAWYCGKIGWWPPHLRGWSGFVRVMMAVCRGIVRTTEALRSVDPEILAVHVDATDLYESADPQLAEEVERRQEIVFLALDLISGRVTPAHGLHGWLLKHGATARELEQFERSAVPLELVGINLYPLFSRKVLVKRAGSLRIQMPYAGAEIIERLTALYANRYGAPVFISETASSGSVKRRTDWLVSSVEATRRARAAGLPLVGYTWWPLFALVTWAYRQGTLSPEKYLKQMGLWDLRSTPDGLERVATSLVTLYRDLARHGAESVGPLQTFANLESHVS